MENFAGWLTPSRGDAFTHCDHDTATATELPGGWIWHTDPQQIQRHDNWYCIIQGAPHFSDKDLRAKAEQNGFIPVWIEHFNTKGPAAATALHGRFSITLIDPVQSSVWLLNDRFGTWPICYSTRAGGLGFSSRADMVPGPQKDISSQSIFDYLFFHTITAPQTIFTDIFRLPAAHYIHWQAGKITCEAWWHPHFTEPKTADFDASKATFLSLIEEGVRNEVSDGTPTGAYLSGGTDSSTVSGMLGKVQGSPARTYSIGFDAAGYDEMEYAQIAARHFKTDHHEYYVTPNDLLEGIPKVAVHYDQPFGNSSAVPAWVCVTRARQDGIEKMLAGDGGDELFGGNTRYAKQRVFGFYNTVPAPLRSVILEPLFGLPGVDKLPLIKKGSSYIEQAKVPMPDRMQMYNLLLRIGPTEVFEPGFLARIDQQAPLRYQQKTWQSFKNITLINHMLAYDWKYTLADNDLPKVIGTTQLAGVEVAFPLLTNALQDFSLGLPPEWKLKGLTLRWFFKEALRGFLPDDILTKKKHGFGLPFGIWACSHEQLGQLAQNALKSLGERNIIRPAFIDDLINRLLPAYPNYYGEMVWIMMMLEHWLQAHAPDYRIQS